MPETQETELAGEVTFLPPSGEAEPDAPAFLMDDETEAVGDETEGEPEPDTPEGAQPESFVFGDRTLTREDIEKSLSISDNATQKWQEAADARRDAEKMRDAFLPVAEAFNSLHPDDRAELFKHANDLDEARRAGKPMAQPQAISLDKPFAYGDDVIDPADLSDGEKAAFTAVAGVQQQVLALQKQNEALLRKLSDMEGVVPEMRDFLTGTKADREASAAAASIKAEIGYQPSNDELREASTQTGIPNLEAAWHYHNRQKVRDGAFQQGHKQGSQPKPKTPTPGARTFELGNLSADQVLKRVQAGQTLV